MLCICISLFSSLVIIFEGTHTPPTWREWFSWWRHQMETFSALLAICAGHSPVTCMYNHVTKMLPETLYRLNTRQAKLYQESFCRHQMSRFRIKKHRSDIWNSFLSYIEIWTSIMDIKGKLHWYLIKKKISGKCDAVLEIYAYLLYYCACICLRICMYMHINMHNMCMSMHLGKHVHVFVFVHL